MFRFFLWLEAPTIKAFRSALLRVLRTFSALSALKLILSLLRPERAAGSSRHGFSSILNRQPRSLSPVRTVFLGGASVCQDAGALSSPDLVLGN